MQVKTNALSPSRWTGDAIVLFLFEGDMEPIGLLGDDVAQMTGDRAARVVFSAKADTFLALNAPGERVRSVYLAGLGKKEKVSIDAWRRAMAAAVKQAGRDRHLKMLAVPGGEASPAVSAALAEGALLGEYRFDKYKSKDDPSEVPTVLEELHIHEGDKEAIEKGLITARAQNFARDLANEPGNVINPVTLAEQARRMAEETGIECTILDEKKMEDLGMNGILSVGGGSHTPPRLIHMIYRPVGTPSRRVAFVGKGLTFDSGGLNIKPGDYMRSMKGDKTGACNAIAIMKAVSEIKPGFEIHAFVGAVENMPGGGAYRPDDVIRMFSGKTVEVDNTDAEGRIVLGDVLAYASKQEPSVIVDMATLTGACVVALGGYTAGIFTNDPDLAASFMEVSRSTGERLWELPMDDERLKKKIRSEMADVVNSGGRYGGAITAAMFLREFVDEGIKWLHMDIAGVDTSDEDYGYYRKGATGFGVRTCLEWLSKYESR
ncbi:MAG: leucyl aminopeptidase [Thermovirgaceae bacterium]|nr:leucyl aminopeptidase [Thermovirgaceae bacterium]